VRRREFLEIAAATLAASSRGKALSGAADQVVTERSKTGRPHQGKVLAPPEESTGCNMRRSSTTLVPMPRWKNISRGMPTASHNPIKC
jgi:hypothetical protein